MLERSFPPFWLSSTMTVGSFDMKLGQVSGTDGTTTLTDAQALAFGTVASVSTGPAGAKLNVPGLGQLTMDDIKQVL